MDGFRSRVAGLTRVKTPRMGRIACRGYSQRLCSRPLLDIATMHNNIDSRSRIRVRWTTNLAEFTPLLCYRHGAIAAREGRRR